MIKNIIRKLLGKSSLSTPVGETTLEAVSLRPAAAPAAALPLPVEPTPVAVAAAEVAAAAVAGPVRGTRVEVPASVHRIDASLLDDRAVKVVTTLQDAGFEAYIVGGAVRDLLLGLHPKDFDIATNAHPEEVRKLFRNCRLIGRRFHLAHVRFGMEIKKLPKAEIDKRVENMIQMLGLEEFRDKYPHQLSVSTAQRIIIGRAFAMQPDLLLMDEPYGQMDIKLRFYLEDEVIRLWKEMGTTVVFITHNIEEAVYLAERVLILTNKPAKIKEEVKIDLPRPRDVTSPEFIKLRNYVTDQIKWW